MSSTVQLRRLANTQMLFREGEPRIVLLHGIGSNAASWSRLIAALDPSIGVLAWDAPGYGASTPVQAASPTPTDYAERLIEILDAIGWNRITLAGHSLGCLFAARFALLHPQRVERLALLSPALGYSVPPGADLPPNVQARIDDLNALGPREFAAKRASRLLYHAETQRDLLRDVQTAMASVIPEGYAQAVRALGAGTLLTDAAALTMPTLVATGAQDVVTPPDNARRLHQVLNHAAPLAILPACGHALPQEAPDTLAALLMERAHV